MDKPNRSSFDLTWGGAVIFALITAWFMAPLLRFANPRLLGGAGLMLGIGAWAIYRGSVLREKGQILIAALFGGIGLIGLTIAGQHTLHASLETDKACLALQGRMLAGNGDANAAGAFDALACRPQFPRKGDLLS